MEYRHRKQPTIEVSAVWVNRWDQRKSRVDGSNHIRVMWQLSHTLKLEKVSYARQSSCESWTNLDGFNPRSTFSCADRPPLPSHPGGATLLLRIGGGEQESRDSYDAEEIKEGHPETRKREMEDGVHSLANKGCFYTRVTCALQQLLVDDCAPALPSIQGSDGD